MKTYLIAHYGNNVPAFSYAETLEEARSQALIRLNSHQCKRDDVLSIVDAANDRIVYYGKRDELIAKFGAAGPVTAPAYAWPFSLKPVLNWIGMKLIGPSVG